MDREEATRLIKDFAKQGLEYFVYMIVEPSGRCLYVGSSRSYKRFSLHESEARNRKGYNIAKEAALREIIEAGQEIQYDIFMFCRNRKYARAVEAALIKLNWNDVANKYVEGSSMMKGRKHSEETKQKISENRKGKLTGKDNPFYGKHHSEEAKRKNAEAHTGEKNSNFGRTGEQNPMFGRKHSEETIKKMRESKALAYQKKRLLQED